MLQYVRVLGGMARTMTTLYSTLALRKRPFSFSDGLTSAFDWTPITENYNASATPGSADARAIASDFRVTGDDLRVALSEYGRTQ
jgi:hypothetical protein